MRTKKMIKRNGPRESRGFTLLELMITTAIMAIVGLAIGVVIVDGQTGWNTMYDRANSDVVTQGYAARKKLDAVIRGASRQRFVIASDGSWIEAYTYASDASEEVDRYWRFYVTDGDLIAEHGQVSPRATLSVETVCGNVSDCTFGQNGKAIQMTLTLDDGGQTNTIVSCVYAHNQ
ncbi:MAG TPA: prepilin-type N-terminal cleavage/methylation domain-containing protein [Phycisphaerales bacterium]|nr:prepilin-type N-terminal cleavage/methylation domain-containing protein [Phycisphaerales bacterium]